MGIVLKISIKNMLATAIDCSNAIRLQYRDIRYDTMYRASAITNKFWINNFNEEPV